MHKIIKFILLDASVNKYPTLDIKEFGKELGKALNCVKDWSGGRSKRREEAQRKAAVQSEEQHEDPVSRQRKRHHGKGRKSRGNRP